MGGAAWDPKNKSPEQLFDELVIKKDEYYDLPPTFEEFLEQQGPNPETGMYARWSWMIKKKREYAKLYPKK